MHITRLSDVGLVIIAFEEGSVDIHQFEASALRHFADRRSSLHGSPKINPAVRFNGLAVMAIRCLSTGGLIVVVEHGARIPVPIQVRRIMFDFGVRATKETMKLGRLGRVLRIAIGRFPCSSLRQVVVSRWVEAISP